MDLPRARYARAFALALAVLACSDGSSSVAPYARSLEAQTPLATKGTSQSTVLARATFLDPSDPVFKVKRISDDWQVEVKSKPGFDLAVQSIVFEPGTHSGWHSHPGPVFILVKTGEMTFYESDDPHCQPIRRKAGEGFLDVGDHAHIARNETDQPAENIVTYFAPPGATLRKDEPAPGNCPF
ncbi:MAG TPA: cupin domain-containing protein [Gemmatimonadaceae bacterium]|jgi:quercetin dioxygenase-like cupin family protein|nr:cupin domain-containing protein [Gemmatimonadaceae bacterium]